MNNDSDMRMGCYRCIAENEHGISNSKSSEYKMSIKTEGPREGHKTQQGAHRRAQ